MPLYAGMRLGVPSLPGLVETLAEGRYDLLHVTAPGPAGIAAVLLSRVAGMPLIGSYHTELGAYAGLRSGDEGLEALAQAGLTAFYGATSVVLSPSPATDRSLLFYAGGGPEEGELRARLGERATFLGWLEGEALARAYASANAFLFCSTTDTYLAGTAAAAGQASVRAA